MVFDKLKMSNFLQVLVLKLELKGNNFEFVIIYLISINNQFLVILIIKIFQTFTIHFICIVSILIFAELILYKLNNK